MKRSGIARSFRYMVTAQPAAVLAVLVGLHLIVTLLAFDPVPHSGGDNAAYLSLARSLLDHGRYLELWHPDRPPHTQYPPGFPALLAVAWTFGLRSWAALKLMMVGFSGLAVGVSYLWMRERTAPTTAATLGLLLAVAPGLAGENQWVLSDIPFWATTMAALLAFARGRDAWGIGLAFLALALRTAALPLLVAVIVWMALRKRWKTAVVMLAVLIGIAILWTSRGPAADAGYVSQFWLQNPYEPGRGRIGVADLLHRVVENADRYTFTILMRTLAGGAGIVGGIAGALFIGAALVGFGRSVLGRRPGSSQGVLDAGDDPAGREGASGPTAAARVGLVEVYSVLYVGMLLAWPWQWASDRFLIPILPVLLVYAARGAAAIPGGRGRRLVQGTAVLAVLGLAASPLVGLWTEAAACRAAVRADGLFACLAPAERSFMELARWSDGRLEEDAVVLSRKPTIWYWNSGYRSERYPFSQDRSRLLEYAAELGARYVVLDELGRTSTVYLFPAVGEYRRWYCAIHWVQRADRAAMLLRVLSEPWDPETVGLPRDLDGQPLQVPRCPPGFVAGFGR